MTFYPGQKVIANGTNGHVAYATHATVYVYTVGGLRAYAATTVHEADCGSPRQLQAGTCGWRGREGRKVGRVGPTNGPRRTFAPLTLVAA